MRSLAAVVIYNHMVVHIRHATNDDRPGIVFHALSDATRRDIYHLVLQGEHSVSDLAHRYPMSFAAVQKHVAVLERAGLVTKQPRGRERLVQGNIDALREVDRLLEEFAAVWQARMERFGEVLAEPDEGDTDASD